MCDFFFANLSSLLSVLGVFLVFLSVLGDSGLCSSVTRLVWIFLMETNNLDMEKKHRSSTIMELEEERDGDWSRWAKRALESCGLWCGHVKGKPLVEMATEERSDKESER